MKYRYTRPGMSEMLGRAGDGSAVQVHREAGQGHLLFRSWTNARLQDFLRVVRQTPGMMLVNTCPASLHVCANAARTAVSSAQVTSQYAACNVRIERALQGARGK